MEASFVCLLAVAAAFTARTTRRRMDCSRCHSRRNVDHYLQLMSMLWRLTRLRCPGSTHHQIMEDGHRVPSLRERAFDDLPVRLRVWIGV
jgi:hypothetical protein